MEFKKKRQVNIFKKAIFSICFCSLLFILLNYYCVDGSRCYWKLNDYSRNRFSRLMQSNRITTANYQTYAALKYQPESNRTDRFISGKRKTRLLNRSKSFKNLKNFNFVNHLLGNNYSLIDLNQVSYEQLESNEQKYQFDLFKDDVLVFLHIQKTGGTSFGKRLVHDLLSVKPCECYVDRKHCNCIRPTAGEFNLTEIGDNNTQKYKSKYWLFSRYSTGWVCGLHADWTRLQFCTENALNKLEKVKLKRRYFFITLLREPVSRFLSEYGHVRRGATWRTSRYTCSDDELNLDSDETKIDEIMNLKKSKCYTGIDWRGVELEEYLKCDKNLAVNRQVKMLADLSKIGCLNNGNRSEYNKLLLESAKANLNRMAYFGILEYQLVSQFVFESTFKIDFKHSFVQLNQTHSTQIRVNNDTLNLIRKLNYLDIELYEFAKDILFKRFEHFKQTRDFKAFERSKLNSLDNLKENLNKFPELRLLQKLSKPKR